MNELLTVKEVAQRLRVSELTVRDYIRRGIIKTTTFGPGPKGVYKRVRITEEEYQRFIGG